MENPTLESEIRLKCLEFVMRNHISGNFPVLQMVQASMIFNWVAKGEYPVHANAFLFHPEDMNLLLEKAYQELIKERNQSNQPPQSSNADTNDLKQSKPFLKSLFCRFRAK